ncbi:MAG: T9SS C-terminal target domain-containing protein, partial [Bacteroidetes bacterium]
PWSTSASVSITDNDKDPMTGLEYTLFSENFEGSTAGWATGQFISANNQNRWLINTTGPLNGSLSAHISPSNNTGVTYNGIRTSSVFLRSPLINATAASNMELSFLFRCNGELLGGTYYDYGRLLYSFDGTNYFVFANNIQGYTSTNIGTITLPDAVNNTSFYLAFGWVNDNSTANNPPFIVDDITIKVAGPKVADDLGASRDHNLSPGATVHFFDEVSGDIIATIENQGTYDYGCTDVTIDRAGTGAVDFWDNAAANNQYDLASKTVIVKPTNNNPGGNGNYRITLYYTQAEVNGWQTATGGVNALNNIRLVKSPDSIKRVSPGNPYPDGPIEVATPVASGTLSGGAYYYIRAAFTSGFSGFGVGITGTNPTFPIEYTYFEATAEQGDALLTWEYVNDNGILYFELERSLDGVHFETFATVDGRYAPQGRHMLSHKDLKVGQYHSEVLYYRIKGADANGQMYQSEVREMHLNFEGFAVKAFPNPFSEQISVDVLTEKEGIMKATLFDGLGRSVLRQSFELSRGLNLLSIDSRILSSGVYTLVLEDSQNRRVTRKLTK